MTLERELYTVRYCIRTHTVLLLSYILSLQEGSQLSQATGLPTGALSGARSCTCVRVERTRTGRLTWRRALNFIFWTFSRSQSNKGSQPNSTSRCQKEQHDARTQVWVIAPTRLIQNSKRCTAAATGMLCTVLCTQQTACWKRLPSYCIVSIVHVHTMAFYRV